MTVFRKLAISLAAAATAAALASCSNSQDAAPKDEGKGNQTEQQATGKPSTPLKDLALTNEDIDGIKVSPIDGAALEQGANLLSGLLGEAQVEPENCRETVNLQESALKATLQDAVVLQGAPEDKPETEATMGISLTGNTSVFEQTQNIATECPAIDITFSAGQESETRSHVMNEKADIPAPEGMDKFNALKQNSDMALGETRITTGTVVISGVVRDILVTVTHQTINRPLDDAAQEEAAKAFQAQVEKIKKAQ